MFRKCTLVVFSMPLGYRRMNPCLWAFRTLHVPTFVEAKQPCRAHTAARVAHVNGQPRWVLGGSGFGGNAPGVR